MPLHQLPADIEAILKSQRAAYNTRDTCPACLNPPGRAHGTTYCETDHTRGLTDMGDTPWLDTSRMGSGRDPHMHIKCQVCGFQWLESPAWIKRS